MQVKSSAAKSAVEPLKDILRKARMRRNPKPATADNITAYLKQIFPGIFYRHEFARRNEDVADASERLFKEFSIPPETSRHFSLGGVPRFLTSLLMEKAVEPSTDGIQRKQMLRDFLTEYRVIPMGRTVAQYSKENAFFPAYAADSTGSFGQLYPLWHAVIKFEVLAQLELELRAPVFFPVMSVGPMVRTEAGGARAATVKIPRDICLAGYSYPVLVDFAVAVPTVTAYMEMLRHHESLRGIASMSYLPKVPSHHSTPWAAFDFYLKAYDLKKQFRERGMMANKARILVAAHEGRPPILGRNGRKAADQRVRDSAKQAGVLVKNYVDII